MELQSDKTHLFELTPEEMVTYATERGVSLRIDEARRFLAFNLSYTPGARERHKQPVSDKKFAQLQNIFDMRELEMVERVEDEFDHFVKYLFRSPDGSLTEAVRIPLHKPGCFTVCLSSQVGCAMGCVFCATGRLGLKRNLRAWEMVSAFKHVRDEAPGRVTGAVFQGQGEPFHNYDHVIRAAQMLSQPCGGRISGRAITISTVGLVPQIRRYAREGHPFRLIVSLTSAIPEKRKSLLPVAGRFSMEEVTEAIREYAAQAKGMMTIAWVVMSGVNTGDDEVQALRERLGDLNMRINLIDINDARPDGFARATPQELKSFLDRLSVLKKPLVRRYSGGGNKHAACGMLAATRWDETPAPENTENTAS